MHTFGLEAGSPGESRTQTPRAIIFLHRLLLQMCALPWAEGRIISALFFHCSPILSEIILPSIKD